MSAVQTVATIRNGAPHVIHSDKQLARYTEALFALIAKKRPTRAEEETIELLTLLIERYEDEHYSIPDASPADVLRFSSNIAGFDSVTSYRSSETKPWCR